MPAVEREPSAPISDEQKEIALSDLTRVRDLQELLIQDNITLERVVACLNERHQQLAKTRGLKGVFQIEERGCRLALRAFANEQLTLEDLKPLKEEVQKQNAQATTASAPQRKRGLFQRILGR